MAALIIAIFPQNSSRGNWEEQQDRTDPNSRFELARKPAWLLAFRQFGLPKWKHDFECRTFDHSDNSPCISTVFRALRKCKKNRQERYEILKFDPAKTLINQGFSAEKTARANAHFECRTFDLSDNSPYTSSVILAPEECKKNTQEQYEIVKSEPAQSPVRRTFSADETAGASKNSESVPL